MVVRLIHTGDWHIAKPFGPFDAEKAPLLRAARGAIVDRVAALARSQGATTVLVAGDVFDGPLIADEVLRRLAVRLERYADLQWHFLPGNHDPATANGIWQRFERIVRGLGANGHVVLHHAAGVTALGAGVELLTAPLHARAIAHDPTEWMMHRASAEGVIRIGLAHGAVQGFGSMGEASVLIAPDRALHARLDYLALGDWHGARQAGVKAWYAGTPEPDRFLDNDPGYALSVQIDRAGAEPIVTRHWLGQYQWLRRVVEGDLLAEVDAIERGLATAPVDGGHVLLLLVFKGRLALDAELELRGRVQRLGDQVFHLEADYSGLTVEADGLVPRSLADPALAAVATRLGDAMATDDEAAAAVAHEAMLLLTEFARGQVAAGEADEAVGDGGRDGWGAAR